MPKVLFHKTLWEYCTVKLLIMCELVILHVNKTFLDLNACSFKLIAVKIFLDKNIKQFILYLAKLN